MNGTAAGPFLPADWPAPPGVHAFTTLRHGAGASRAPFDTFNLGNRTAADGDDPATVDANRAELVRLAGLPAVPHWLKQVHGTDVVRVEGDPHPNPPPQAGEGDSRAARTRASASPADLGHQRRPSTASRGSTPFTSNSTAPGLPKRRMPSTPRATNSRWATARITAS